MLEFSGVFAFFSYKRSDKVKIYDVCEMFHSFAHLLVKASPDRYADTKGGLSRMKNRENDLISSVLTQEHSVRGPLEKTAKSNHLTTVMKRLQISSKELALSLRINATLVSKYRNQKRRISKELAEQIASYIILDFCRGYTCLQSNLKDLLEPYSEKSIEAYTIEELVPLLADYLLDDSQVEDRDIAAIQHGCWDTQVQLYTGLQGWKDVTSAFAERAVKRSNHEIYIGEFVYFDYEKQENYEIYSHANQVYMDLIEAGHKLTLITTMKEEYQSYGVLIKWLQLYARDNIEVYYLEFPDKWDYQQSVVVEKGEQVYVNLDAHRDYEKDIYMRVTDPAVVDYYYRMLREMKTYAHPLLEKIKIHQQQRLQYQMEKDLFPGRTVYLLDSVPTYRNMPESVLLQVLEDNGIENALKEEILNSFHWWENFYAKNHCRCIFDLEEIEKNCAVDQILDYELSAIVGREIYVKQEYLQQHFQYLLYNHTWSRFQMAYYPFSKLELVYRYLTMIVQGDNLLIMWSMPNCKNCLQYHESSYIGGCKRYLKHLWQELPNANKNRDSFFERVAQENS